MRCICVVLLGTTQDHWQLRNAAARLVAVLCRRYGQVLYRYTKQTSIYMYMRMFVHTALHVSFAAAFITSLY
jgi:TAF6 C-terminal HEAT repeat domain